VILYPISCCPEHFENRLYSSTNTLQLAPNNFRAGSWFSHVVLIPYCLRRCSVISYRSKCIQSQGTTAFFKLLNMHYKILGVVFKTKQKPLFPSIPCISFHMCNYNWFAVWTGMPQEMSGDSGHPVWTQTAATQDDNIWCWSGPAPYWDSSPRATHCLQVH